MAYILLNLMVEFVDNAQPAGVTMQIESSKQSVIFGPAKRADYVGDNNSQSTTSGYASTDASQNTPPSAAASAVTGLVTSRIADNTIGALIQQSQETNVVVRGEPTQFEKLNAISQSDRKLLEAMTGYNVSEFGKFTDQNGNTAYPEDLTQHTLRTFQMTLHAARNGYPEGAIAGEDITVSEFTTMMERTRAGVSSMGERFNENYMAKGLAYLTSLA
ncbi:MAG TPA: hypothetical protein VIN57_01850 [Magnetovibrio sp.]